MAKKRQQGTECLPFDFYLNKKGEIHFNGCRFIKKMLPVCTTTPFIKLINLKRRITRTKIYIYSNNVSRTEAKATKGQKKNLKRHSNKDAISKIKCQNWLLYLGQRNIKELVKCNKPTAQKHFSWGAVTSTGGFWERKLSGAASVNRRVTQHTDVRNVITPVTMVSVLLIYEPFNLQARLASRLGKR